MWEGPWQAFACCVFGIDFVKAKKLNNMDAQLLGKLEMSDLIKHNRLSWQF